MSVLTRLLADRRTILTMVCFAIIAFLTYGSSLNNDFVNFDDYMLVKNNPAIQSISWESVRFVFTHFDPELYIPLTFLSYQLDYAIGTGPFIFHVTNLILHIVNALLLMWIAGRLIENRMIAILLGLIFLVHPLHTETVAWISARKDLLSTLFMLLSWMTYIKYTEERERRPYIISLILFVLGLLSKVMIATLPLLLLLSDWLQHRPIDRSCLKEKVPYLIFSSVFIVIAIAGKTAVLQDSPPLTMMLMAAKSCIFYVQQFFAPHGLSVLYPYTDTVSLSSPDFFVPVFLIILVNFLSLFSLRYNRFLMFGWLFFVTALIPTFTNFSKEGLYFASDRYAYVPSMGLLIGIAGFILHRNSSTKIAKALTTFMLCAALPLMFFAHRRSLDWKNTVTLFTDVLEHYPNAYIAHSKIGAALLDTGDKERAEHHIRTSLDIRPNHYAHYNLGLLYIEAGNNEEALLENERALSLSPHYAAAHINAGYLRWLRGEYLLAEDHFQQAVKYDPFAFDALLNLASVQFVLGKTAESRATVVSLLSIEPNKIDAMALLQKIER